MSVWKCPHCTSVQILTGEISDYRCNKLSCGAILDRLDEPEAGRAMRAAFYGHDHGFTSVAEQLERAQSVNAGLQRIVKAIEPEAP